MAGETERVGVEGEGRDRGPWSTAHPPMATWRCVRSSPTDDVDERDELAVCSVRTT